MPPILRRFAAVPLLLLSLALCCVIAQPAAAASEEESSAVPTPHPSIDAVKAELTAVIDAQLAAFRADDYSRAYTFAAAGIRAQFPAADFEKMVRTAYPRIARSASADYGLALDNGDEPAVAVRVTGADPGAGSAEYLYTLTREQDGAWKITGVSEIKPGGVQA